MPYAQACKVIYLTSPRQFGFLQNAGETRQVLASPWPGRALRALPADQPGILVVDAQWYSNLELQRLIGIVRRYRPFSDVVIVCPAEMTDATREHSLRQTGAKVVMVGLSDWLQNKVIEDLVKSRTELAAAS